MTTFEIYTKSVVINDKTYSLRPLTGEQLPALYKLAGKMSELKDLSSLPEEEQGLKMIERLDAEDLISIQAIGVEMLVRSYPQDKREAIEDFVSRNLFPVFMAAIEVNLGNA